MATFILKRFLQLIPVLFVVSVMVFAMVHLAPGDPAITMAGGRQTSPEVLSNIRVKYHLNDSVFKQYLYWAKDAVTGNLGESYKLKQPVSGMITGRLPVTIQLVLMTIVLTLLISIPLGMLGAVKKGTWLDTMISVFTFIGVSSPVFLTGILAILLFSYKLNLFPAFGVGKGILDNFRYLFLPALSLTLSMVALSSRITRSSMIDVLNTNYIQTAVAKGMPRKTVIFKHGFRNALIPLVTVTGMQLGFLIVGTVLVEYTFGIGGLGSLVINALQTNDYPVIQGTVLFLVFAFLMINLVVDVLYALIDPRIRYR